MKEILLNNLKLTNFKGIKDREIDFSGVDRYILGTNETGKTTLFDAFTWLLFDKDSSGSSQFDIKTLDEDNNAIHHLDHTVEGEIQVIDRETGDRQKYKLKKVYKEVWTRSRGKSEQEFSKHTTDHFVNDVPKLQKEYNEIINNIISEDLFKQLTDPLYFNEQLHWKDRRNVIFDLAEQPGTEEIAKQAANKHKQIKADRLVEALDNKTDDEYMDMIKSSMREINKKLEEIPARIDEIQRSLPDGGVDDKAKSKLEDRLGELKYERKKIKEQIDEAKSGEVSLKQEIASKKAELSEKKIELRNEKSDEIEQLRNQIGELKDKLQDKKRKLKDFKEEVDKKKENIKEWEKKRKELLEKYHSWKEKQFDEDAQTCPACKQELPADKIEEHRQEFNKKKSEEMEDIVEKGKKIKSQIEEAYEWLDYTEKPATEEEIEDLEAEIEGLEAAKEDLIEEKLKVPELESLEKEIQSLENQNPEGQSSEKVEELQEDLDRAEDKIGEIDKKILQIENAQKAKTRQKELQEQEQKLINKYNELEIRQFELEEFRVEKANIMEEAINSKFNIVNWKLFDRLVSGGMQETCVALKDGVPYDSMNTGSKYQAGMDIINTLSRVYKVQAPVFIDNRERIAKLPEIESQTIHLIMAPGFDELEVWGTSAGDADDIVEEYSGLEQDTLF